MTPTAPLVPLPMASPKLVAIERELEAVSCIYLLNGRVCGQSVPVRPGHLRCVRRVQHADQHRPAGINHGTSVYLPLNIAIRSLVPRTACTARVDIDPWAGGPGRCDGCDGGRGGRRVPLGLLGHGRAAAAAAFLATVGHH